MDSYETTAYSYTQFERPALRLTGQGTTTPLDFNENGLFDRLDIAIEIESDVSGFFQWTAVLKDEFGTKIGLSAGSSSLSVGSNNLGFSFAGTAIRANGFDGPYFLSDLLLFSTNGVSLTFPGNFYETDALLARDFEGYIPPTSPPEAICQESVVFEISTATPNNLDMGSSGPEGSGPEGSDPDVFGGRSLSF